MQYILLCEVNFFTNFFERNVKEITYRRSGGDAGPRGARIGHGLNQGRENLLKFRSR